MKRYVLATLLLLPCLLRAQEQSSDWSRRKWSIPEVTVFGQRPLKEIGTQQTKLDSTVLKENISLSMADILTFNSPIFVKSYGRATLSTVSFRGTSASHTQVTWNGMRINNPMLGMTDFSMIPSYFIDDASLLHGTSSVNETGGGLGGSIKLSTQPAQADGFGIQYIQGIGSFQTFDEFLRLTYGNRHWQLSTRVVYSTSPNNYRYRNRDKKENIYDEQMNIIGQYYPTERNRSGSFKDLHLLQEAYYNTGRGDKWGLNAWFIHSNRELPMLTTDYGRESEFENRQREETFRSVASWQHMRSNWQTNAKAGYIHTKLAYDYKRDVGNGQMATMTRSRSQVNTLYAQTDGEYHLHNKWLFTASASMHQHFVESRDKNIIRQDGNQAIVGYQKARFELSTSLSAKWRPTDRIGLSAVLRKELYGHQHTPFIPALFFDGVLSKRGEVVFKASLSRNFRYPTLNDLYFLPGGNPDLKHESGWIYDAGLSFAIAKEERFSLSGSINWFDSHIADWILWLPTTKGFFSPRNVKDVHAYGIEAKADSKASLGKHWHTDISVTYSWTPSINRGQPLTAADRSIGKQLPYTPRHSATLNARIAWKSWSLLYKWCHYGERYTMSSNDLTLTGKLTPYYMSNLTLEKQTTLSWADLMLKGSINNLFDEEYLSVLSRPMPGINFELFIGITLK